MTKVRIYSPLVNSALRYVFDFVFREFSGWDYEILSSSSASAEAHINYSTNLVDGPLWICPHGYLNSDDLLSIPDVAIEHWKDIPVFLKTQGEVPFDIFAAIFIMLSRAEEYNKVKRDKHDRFPASQCLAVKHGFNRRPIVDEWILGLQEELSHRFGLKPRSRTFKWINTYDIDIAYAYRGRSLIRNVGATIKNAVSGNFNLIAERFSVLIRGKTDPFDTYEFQKKVSEQYADRTVYFFLVGDRSEYDINLSHANRCVRQLIEKTAAFAEVGIHPSYRSEKKKGSLEQEIGRLEKILDKKVKLSRQHFLKFSLPNTQRRLISAGILEDFTLGYAETIGFRSGTASEHYFFDILQNTSTHLKMVPLHAMEGALRDYMNLNPDEAKEILFDLAEKVKKVKGSFVTLWHNDSLSEQRYPDWRRVYLELAVELSKWKR